MNADKYTAKYVTKDSGKKAGYADGMQRDTTEGKPRFDLLFPEEVPYEDQLLTRVADLYMRGGVKYGDRNWEKSSTVESLAHHKAALMRHAIKFLLGVNDGEDHAAAVVWNVNAVDLTRRNLTEKAVPDPAEVFVKAETAEERTEKRGGQASPRMTVRPPVSTKLPKAVPVSKKALDERRPVEVGRMTWNPDSEIEDNCGNTWMKVPEGWMCPRWVTASMKGYIYKTAWALAYDYGPLKVTVGNNAGAVISPDGAVIWP